MTDMVAIPQDRRSVRFATHALEIGFAILFVVLAWNNFTLRRQLAAAVATPARNGADAGYFITGDKLERLDVLDLSGRPAAVDFRSTRTLVAIVNPTCRSCVATVADLTGARNARVLSVASPAETAPLVAKAGLAPVTSIVPPNLGGDAGRKLVHFPQVLIVDKGMVVRTCKTVSECSR
jgi:hypothetical protein